MAMTGRCQSFQGSAGSPCIHFYASMLLGKTGEGVKGKDANKRFAWADTQHHAQELAGAVGVKDDNLKAAKGRVNIKQVTQG